jgi:anti-sigma regulatory factor (Ser/Thr protein kinase)
MSRHELPTDSKHRRDSHELRRSLASLDEMFGFLETNLAGGSIDARTIFVVKLAAEEIFANFVRHNESASDSISIEIDISADSVVLRLVDRGVDPFDPATQPHRNVPRRDNEEWEGGFGLHLVRSLADELSYECENREMKVTVVKDLGD